MNNTQEINETARLVLRCSEIQQQIMKRSAAGESTDSILSSGIIEERDAVEKELRASNKSNPKDGLTVSTDDERVSLGCFTFEEGERVGLPNKMDELEIVNPEFAAQMSLASEIWIRRLSSLEIGSLLDYAGSSIDYAKAAATGDDDCEILHRALNKAPRISQEVTVYSGLSSYVRATVLAQIDSGARTIRLDRAQSASFNPAQVNGFMSSWEDGKGATTKLDTVALEILTDSGAVMTRISQAPYEMEILLPPSQYEVLGEMKDVMYRWTEGGAGRIANRVIKLRRISTD